MRSLIKKILKESAHLEGLYRELPLFLRRRLTMEDLEWLDRELQHHILITPPTRNNFDAFCDYVLGDLLHEFLVDVKADEVDTIEDPEYGEIFNDESLDKVATIYWNLIPYLKKRYEIRLRQAWERKKSL
jgi:hypothetical protein